MKGSVRNFVKVAPLIVIILLAFAEFFTIEPVHGFSYFVVKIPAFESYVIGSYLVAIIICSYPLINKNYRILQNIYLILLITLLLILSTRIFVAGYLLVYPSGFLPMNSGSLFEKLYIQFLCFIGISAFFLFRLFKISRSLREFQLVAITIVMSGILNAFIEVRL